MNAVSSSEQCLMREKMAGRRAFCILSQEEMREEREREEYVGAGQ